MVGSGGLVVMNRHTCMVSVARFFMQFTQNESCGKCVLCREGTKQMLALLDDIIEGRADQHTLDLLEQLAKAVGKGSLCGTGQDGAEPGAVDASELPGRSRSPCVPEALSRRTLQGASDARDFGRQVQGLHGMCSQVPGRRDLGGTQNAALRLMPRRASSAAHVRRRASSTPSSAYNIPDVSVARLLQTLNDTLRI